MDPSGPKALQVDPKGVPRPAKGTLNAGQRGVATPHREPKRNQSRLEAVPRGSQSGGAPESKNEGTSNENIVLLEAKTYPCYILLPQPLPPPPKQNKRKRTNKFLEIKSSGPLGPMWKRVYTKANKQASEKQKLILVRSVGGPCPSHFFRSRGAGRSHPNSFRFGARAMPIPILASRGAFLISNSGGGGGWWWGAWTVSQSQKSVMLPFCFPQAKHSGEGFLLSLNRLSVLFQDLFALPA